MTSYYLNEPISVASSAETSTPSGPVKHYTRAENPEQIAEFEKLYRPGAHTKAKVFPWRLSYRKKGEKRKQRREPESGETP